MIAIIHTTIYDFHQYVEDAYILFDEKIEAIGSMSDYENHGYQEINGQGQIVMPGLVNGHSHIYSTFSRGLALAFDPKNFQDLLDQLWWKLDGQLDLVSIYGSAIAFGRESMLSGVTTLLDHHASGLDIQGSLAMLVTAIVDDLGLRGDFCFETSDRFDVEACIAENLWQIKNQKHIGGVGLFGLHASMSLSEETLERVADRLGDQPIHIHVAESKEDEATCQAKYSESIIRRLDRHQLLNDHSLLVHCNYIEEEDYPLITDNNCRVVVNVTSNMNNGVGLPPIKDMMAAGIQVMIGNDGLGSSMTTEWTNVYYSSHHREASPTALSLDQVLEMIRNTQDYGAFTIGKKIGRLGVGYEADLQLLDYIPPTPMNEDNVFAHLFFSLFQRFRPKDVWCRGKHLVKNYRLEQTLRYHVPSTQEMAMEVWKRLKD